MKAAPVIVRERITFEDGSFIEMMAWRVPEPLLPSTHSYKYSLSYVAGRRCVLRYDNEGGKGDHRPADGTETPIAFESLRQVVRQFIAEVKAMRGPQP